MQVRTTRTGITSTVNCLKGGVSALALSLVMIYCPMSVAQPVEDGLAAYEAGDLDWATKALMANRGDPRTHAALYELTIKGKAWPNDRAERLQWLDAYMKNKPADALTKEADEVLSATPKPDPFSARAEDAVYVLTKLSDAGLTEATMVLGRYYLSEDPIRSAKGIALLKKNVGDPFSSWLLGSAYMRGMWGVEPDQVVASGYWSSLARDENARADLREKASYYILLSDYFRARGKPEEESKIAKKIANRDDRPSKGLYAWMLYHGEGVTADKKKAVALAREALKDEHIGIYSNNYGPAFPAGVLASGYEEGVEGKPNQTKADEYLLKLGAPGSADLQMLLRAKGFGTQPCHDYGLYSEFHIANLRIGNWTSGLAKEAVVACVRQLADTIEANKKNGSYPRDELYALKLVREAEKVMPGVIPSDLTRRLGYRNY